MDISRVLPKDMYDAAIGAASPSASNVFATIADVTASDTLAEILAIGNTTGSNSIIVDSAQVISTDNATPANRFEIMFNNSLGNDYIHIQRNGGGDGGSVYVAGGTAIIETTVSARQHELQVGFNNFFTFTDTGGTTRPVLALHDDTNGNNGLITTAALATVDRTWTLPDATGTVALTSDLSGYLALTGGTMSGTIISGAIQALQIPTEGWISLNGATDSIGLWHTATDNKAVLYNGTTSGIIELLAGNTTGKIQLTGGLKTYEFDTTSFYMPNGNDIQFNGTSFNGSLVSATLTTSNKTWTLPDATGTIALTTDITGLGSGITQTYATATSTHSARTYSTLTDSTGGTADTTVAAVSGSGDDATINNNFADILAQLANLAADQQNTAQVLNQVIDNIQAA